MYFLDYTGKYSQSGEQFIFKMKNGKKKRSKFSTIISNPTYDNTFAKIFCTKKSILKSLLNSILFPESKLIEKIEYSTTYFPGKEAINHRYGFLTKSMDVCCNCFLKQNNNLKIKNNMLMIDMEMQIGFTDDAEPKFIGYSNVIKSESNFSDIWVLSFILKESLNSKNNTIELNKINCGSVISMKKYQDIKIIEINLNYCYSLIEENKDVKIMEELGQEGKEWVKLISCPIWCQNYNSREDIYIIPKYTQKGFISCNFVKKAIEEIIYRPQAFDLSRVDEHYNKEERKKYFLMEKENKALKEKLKKYEKKEEEEEEDEDDCSDIDDENDEEDNEQKSDDEEDEDRKNNNSKDEDAQDDMDIED